MTNATLKLSLVVLAACKRSDPTPPPPPQRPTVEPIAGVAPVEGDFAIEAFHFASGETLPALRIHYMTLGTAKRDVAGHVTNAVIVMHGTNGSGSSSHASSSPTCCSDPDSRSIWRGTT